MSLLGLDALAVKLERDKQQEEEKEVDEISSRAKGSRNSRNSVRSGNSKSVLADDGNLGKRSGVGLDVSEWEAPIALSSTVQGSELALKNEKNKRDIEDELESKNFRPADDNQVFVDDPEALQAAQGDAFDDFQRQFYGAVDDSMPAFIGDEQKWEKRTNMLQREGVVLRPDARQRNDDQDAWESSLLARTGVKGVSSNRFSKQDFSELEERVQLRVHNVKPAFLNKASDISIKLSGIKETVGVVKDPTSDMAMVATNGSQVLKELREVKQKTKMRHRFWELGGSRIGKAMGVSGKTDTADFGESKEGGASKEEVDLEGTNFRDRTGFAKHIKQTDQSAQERIEMKATREALPIYQVKTQLLQVIRENQVVVIVGETGSGKTTQLTQYLLEDGYGKRGKIGCTQPRRVAAMSVAKRVSEEHGCKLGTTVGYAIRFEDCTSDETQIKYMTDGVLLRETLSSKYLDEYSCVVMDEAHERSLNTDVLFGILKAVVRTRLDFKLIVTSATLDSDKFAAYYGGCAQFHIPGRTYKVETYFSKSTCPDYVEAAVRKIIEIHLQNTGVKGDILVFMTGQEDITGTCELVAERIGQLGQDIPPLLLLPMYSQLPADLQAKIFEPAEEGQRKCIVCTNIAETSLTVNGILFVVDSGFCKMNVFNPRVGMDALTLTPIAQANANQRSGRAGRTAPGYCWRMYTEVQYKLELLPTQVPDIQRTNLGNVVLLLKSLGVEDITSFEFMDQPPRDNLINSMYQLWVLGAIDGDARLTDLGRKMSNYPLDPALSKMLITADRLHCSAEMVTIVSMLSVPDIFYRPPQRAEESDAAREKFFVPESDHLTLLNVYLQCKRNAFSASWCTQHFIHPKAVLKARDVRAQLLEVMPKDIKSSGTNWEVVREAITSAYLVQAARIKGIAQYVNLLSGITGHLHPSSALCGMGQTPEYVVYHELVLTSKEYMRSVTAVDPKWLAEIGPMFYSIKLENGTVLKQANRAVSAGAEDSKVKPDDIVTNETMATGPRDKKEKGRSGSDSEGELMLQKLRKRQKKRRRQFHI